MEPQKYTQRYKELSLNLKYVIVNALENPLAQFPMLGVNIYLIEGNLRYSAKNELLCVILDYICRLYQERPLELWLGTDFKEIDFYFRDRNSEEWLPSEFRGENLFFEIKTAVKAKNNQNFLLEKRFPSFHSLKIIDKITLIREILSVKDVKDKIGEVELVDIENLVIIVNFHDKAFLEEKLEWLHQLLVDKFDEPKLNVIPEY